MLGGPQAVVTIGLEPDRIKNLPHIKDLLKRLIGTDPATRRRRARRARACSRTTSCRSRPFPYDARYRTVIRPKLYPVPGVFFRRSHGVLGASSLLGAQLIGSVGEITAERLKELGPPYRVGDTVGLSGLQAAYETRLAGTPNADDRARVGRQGRARR